jgi:hypothetical protein
MGANTLGIVIIIAWVIGVALFFTRFVRRL